ncbi:hypothetical protein M409DRAFT_27502 [Zasmidium cellare ATCC 36951]|uniref:Uncharacterized protein n=1 Tax=Zasmidium cellare ATCC 36951 TaxID=1080233 RepID=A0A6A6C8B0_ZASCE|nr:uncharacterized protein M409DRAFT_27502 [Zasmidium cellare ATCC 36951]KAF2162122.1 hypothetical protein M409DRAFT_27502 [Zasmidium cellare ATCC 36951]
MSRQSLSLRPLVANDSATALIERSPQPSSSLDPEYLRQQARWIRDTLDPQVAQDGPDALHSDETLTLDELLRKILDSHITLEDIRYSRMHLAITEIAGRATRWPKKLIDKCDAITEIWESKYGPLNKMGTPLYESGGRLFGICKPEDLSKEKLLVKWLKQPGSKLSPAVARRAGDLGFTPGDWWISPLFAHRAGIIDSGNSDGGVVSDHLGAYAVVLTDQDEISGSDPETCQYRARDRDPGRYRLTAGTPGSRHPIRILRSHSLHSFWKPKAGLRYDGLHKVMGWTIKTDPKTSETVFLITFKRLPNEVSMDTVLSRPFTDEVEDYTEYKRLRHVHREKQKESSAPGLQFSADGSLDIYQDETAQSPFQEAFTDQMPDEFAPKAKGITEVSPNQKR